MFSVLKLQWQSPSPHKHAIKEALFIGRNVYVIADGDIHSKIIQEESPYPSPDSKVAKAVANAIGTSVVKEMFASDRFSPQKIKAAFHAANLAAREINKKFGFWMRHHDPQPDLAGAMAVCAVTHKSKIHYGVIGNCAITRLSSYGDIITQPPHQVQAASAFSPNRKDLDSEGHPLHEERNLRNKPGAAASFGVLTGEETAIECLWTAIFKPRDREVIALHSDGLTPLVNRDRTFRSLLIQGNKKEIYNYISNKSLAEENYDDKTLILLLPR